MVGTSWSEFSELHAEAPTQRFEDFTRYGTFTFQLVDAFERGLRHNLERDPLFFQISAVVLDPELFVDVGERAALSDECREEHAEGNKNQKIAIWERPSDGFKGNCKRCCK